MTPASDERQFATVPTLQGTLQDQRHQPSPASPENCADNEPGVADVPFEDNTIGDIAKTDEHPDPGRDDDDCDSGAERACS
jgi:hypothetical protein